MVSRQTHENTKPRDHESTKPKTFFVFSWTCTVGALPLQAVTNDQIFDKYGVTRLW